MPSLLHETLVLLFRNRPALAPELIRDALGQPLPPYDQIEVREADLSQITPTEYRADLVVLLRAEKPALGIVVEVQLSQDTSKPYSWPLYAAALRAQLRCPSCVLVVTPSATIAKWAALPIALGPPNAVFSPLVLGPQGIPRVTDPSLARASPELAVLSAQAHGKRKGAAPIAMAALTSAAGLDDKRAMLYFDLVLHAVNAVTRQQLEEMMDTGTYQFQSAFAKKYLAKGKAEGKAEGEAKGKAEGEAKGKAEGKAEDILRILSARKIKVSKTVRSKILACTDLPTLDEWISRAVTAPSAADVTR